MKTLWKRLKFFEYQPNSKQNKMEFYAVLIPVFLSTEMFKHNHDLEELVEKFRVNTRIKSYLYDSRTALIARLIREINKNSEEELKFNMTIFKEYSLGIIEKKGLTSSNDITKIINKYSRNNKDGKNE